MRSGTLEEYHRYVNSEPWGPREIFLIDGRSIPARVVPPKRAAPTVMERCPRCRGRAITSRTHTICLRSAGGCGAMTPLDDVTALRRALAEHGA